MAILAVGCDLIWQCLCHTFLSVFMHPVSWQKQLLKQLKLKQTQCFFLYSWRRRINYIRKLNLAQRLPLNSPSAGRDIGNLWQCFNSSVFLLTKGQQKAFLWEVRDPNSNLYHSLIHASKYSCRNNWTSWYISLRSALLLCSLWSLFFFFSLVKKDKCLCLFHCRNTLQCFRFVYEIGFLSSDQLGRFLKLIVFGLSSLMIFQKGLFSSLFS